MRRQYGRLGSFVTVCEDLRDIGRRLDALEAGRRSDNNLPDDEFQKKAGREAGWYPVQITKRMAPFCARWDGAEWLNGLDGKEPLYCAHAIAWIGPRLDLPEGR